MLLSSETCNCHSTIFTNWWINPPYVDAPGANKSGIITPVLKQAVYSCCGNCTEHGNSRIDFDYTATGHPARKPGLLQFKRNFEETTELHFPVYGFMDQTRYSDNYGFVPFVQSPGLALIIIGDEKGTAATLVMTSLAFCFPILFLSIAMLWVSSLAMWFVVSPDTCGCLLKSFCRSEGRQFKVGLCMHRLLSLNRKFILTLSLFIHL